jgi:predicted outer membrane repeat protein
MRKWPYRTVVAYIACMLLVSVMPPAATSALGTASDFPSNRDIRRLPQLSKSSIVDELGERDDIHPLIREAIDGQASVDAATLLQTDGRVLCVNAAGGSTTAPCINTTEYTTIQAAVNAARNGDQIRIARGTYTSSNASVVTIWQKSISLVGGFKNNNWTTPGTSREDTVVDGQARRQGFYIEDASVTIAFLTVTNGKSQTGGGVYANTNASQTIRLIDVLIANNEATSAGGGLFLVGGLSVIDGAVIIGNRANEQDGGGYFGNALTMVDSIVAANTAKRNGGGVKMASGSLEGTVIAENIASTGDGGGVYTTSVKIYDTLVGDNSAGSFGGGIYGNSLTITASDIENNVAKSGGGVFARNDVSLVGTIVLNNSAESNGGGVYQADASRKAQISDSIIAGNLSGSSGGGVYADGVPTIARTEILENTAATNGGGLYSASPYDIAIIGTVFGNNRANNAGDGIFINDQYRIGKGRLVNVTVASAQHAPHAAVQIEGLGSSLELVNTALINHAVGIARSSYVTLSGDYNAVWGNGADQTVGGTAQPLPFANLITADPQFVDPANADFHLREGSPLIDKGDPNRSYTDQYDIDGDPVPIDGRADIGADEFFPIRGRVYIPIVIRP